MGQTVHTFPINDVVEHDTDNFDACICGPDVEYVEGGGKLVTHHSLDGREIQPANSQSGDEAEVSPAPPEKENPDA